MSATATTARSSRARGSSAGVAEAGRGLPAIEPGMPLPAGTGLDRRTFLSRTLGAALTVYGASRARPARLRRGDRAPRRRAGHSTCSSPSSRPGGWDALSVLYPNGDPQYRQLRPRSRSTRRRAGSRATRACTGIRRSSRSRSCTPAARLTVFPAIGYSHPDQSHFTSRHYWEVGALDPQLSTGLARPAARRDRRRRERDAGALARSSLLPSLATARVPVATLATRPVRLRPHNVWDVGGALLPDAIGLLGGHRRPRSRS